MAELEIKDLSKSFAKTGHETVDAFRDISLTVRDGEFVSIVGPSGCGKSTLLYIVAGFIASTRGSVTVDGTEIRGPGTDRGIVFQEYALFPWRTVLGNVTYGLERAGYSKRDRVALAMEGIKGVGLAGFEHRYPKDLSGGMKQRVAIARTLVCSPDVILMDEPYGALDSQTREEMQDQLLAIWREIGTTVIMVTHDVTEAVYLSQKVVVMTGRPGTIKAEIPVSISHDRPRDEIMVSEEFQSVRNEVWLTVREEVRKSIPAGER